MKTNTFARTTALAFLIAAGAMAACVIASSDSFAAVVYDNFTSADTIISIDDRSYTGVFRSDINQTIGGIGALVSAPVDGDLKFVLFDLGNSGSPASSGSLVFTQQKHFLADAAFDYKASNPFSFTFTAGEWYAVGAIANAAFSISYDGATSVNPGAGYTAFADNNVNFTNFADPSNNFGFGCCNIHYQLYSTTAPIPEPEIYAMLAAGLGLMGFVARRRKQRDAAFG